MKLLKSVLVAGSWFVLSTVYAQSGPASAAGALNSQAEQQDQRTIATDTASAAVREVPRIPQVRRKPDECVGPASYCSLFFGGS
ncbi:MAG TPA: hypothetical protein VGP09_22305 [Caballeronia sp.]|jgi:hypothetical protein|nr:hypothetical protein [Caballeronia sp.]HEV7836081.1 hypothetical protein [Caballeronia sp.]